MTSNERKIINFLRDAKEKTHIRLIAKKTNFSSDYTQSLCRSLARAGYVKLEDSNVCHLLKKGQGHFESVAVMREVSEPVVVTANVTLLTDEPAIASPVNDRSDVVQQSSQQEEENKEEDASEEKDKDKPASSDEEFDKALADLEPSSQKDESEEKYKPEEPRDETENELRESEEEKAEEMAEDSKEEINTGNKEDALNKEVLTETDHAPAQAQYGAGVTAEGTMEKPDETELKPELKAEEEKKTAPEAEMKTATDTADGKEEAKTENPEKVALKEEPVLPSSGSGWSFKKIVNWFTEKK